MNTKHIEMAGWIGIKGNEVVSVILCAWADQIIQLADGIYSSNIRFILEKPIELKHNQPSLDKIVIYTSEKSRNIYVQDESLIINGNISSLIVLSDEIKNYVQNTIKTEMHEGEHLHLDYLLPEDSIELIIHLNKSCK